jgi:putative flippase GtrA
VPARLLFSPKWQFQLVRYLTIGGIASLMDLALLWAFLRAGIHLATAVTLAYAIPAVLHFSLNKFANFRIHTRETHRQALTYVAVTILCWLATIAIVEMGVVIFRLPPLVSKLFAIVINAPLGFLGHRYLTFGHGFGAAFRSFLNLVSFGRR